MKAAERQERAEKALAMFISGSTYIEIAVAVGLRTPSAAHKIVEKALADAAQRRLLLSDEALAIHQERQERLLLAHWGPATRDKDPDHRSALVCQRILGQQARMYGLNDDSGARPLPAPTSPVTVDDQDDDDEPQDDLSKLRAQRGTG